MRRLRSIFSIIVLYTYDAALFLQYGNFGYRVSKDLASTYDEVINAHRIEKGLSLPSRRKMFGRSVLEALLKSRGQSRKLGIHSIEMVNGAVSDYMEFNKDELRLKPEWSKRIESLHDANYKSHGGVRSVPREIGYLKPVDFLASRYSSRKFVSDKVNIDLVKKIVSVALRAPSQCNRQSINVSYIQDKGIIERCLALQGGARGFAQDVANLFVVTGDLAGWQGMQQRNQVFVDGGLFSMMLLLSIQANNLGCCPLNAALTPLTERKILNLIGKSKSNRIVMFIAFGYQGGFDQKDTLEVAYSHRDSLKNKLEIV